MPQKAASRPRLLQAMIDAFSLPDLRKRILMTLAILVGFRVIAHVPVPGVDASRLAEIFSNNALLGMFDMFSGGAFRNFSIAAMGVYPYITASIVITLMTPIIPRLQMLSTEGEAGRNKINQITHWLTVPLAGLSGYGQLTLLQREGAIASQGALGTTAIILSLIAGTLLLVWLGEQITQYGIGNGVSIIIFAGIVAGLPQTIGEGILTGEQGQVTGLVVFILLSLLTTYLIVVFSEAHRRIPVQYAKSTFKGGRMYKQSGSSYIPLRVNTAGMIPLIFAMAIVTFPGIVASYFANGSTTAPNFAQHVYNIFNASAAMPLGLVYWVLYFLLVLGFSFFYTSIIFQQQDLPGILQRQGGFIPGIRPGKQTADYLNKIIMRITWAGAIFLAVVAILPFLAREFTGVTSLQLSSTGMLIVVGVVLDTMKQVEAQLSMRRYEGFIK
jgi:preprotein translocase subunit SecY